MEWIGPLVIGILVVTCVFQLLFAHALSVIARKTDQGSLMEVLAWIPMAQLAPMLAVGGGSLGRFLLGALALCVANVALLGAAAFLGDGLGGTLGFLGIGATCLLVIAYYGRILWNTATARDLPGWVGLLMFVPLANLVAYPIIAFHDGWVGPHKVGMMLGLFITIGSMAPYYQMSQMLEENGGFPAEFAELAALSELSESPEFQDLGQLDSMPSEIVAADPTTAGAAPAPMPAEVAQDHEKSIRALYNLKGRFDTLDALTVPENMLIQDHRVRALSLVQSIRSELETNRADLDPKTYEELAMHLITVEAQVHGDGSKSTSAGRSPVPVAHGAVAPNGTGAPGPAAIASFSDRDAAPRRPFPVQVSESCPAGTELRSRASDKGDEEWCQQLSQYGGLRQGWYTRYFTNGRPEQVGEYRDGLRVGVWTRFYGSGEIRAQAQFAKGLQDGWLLSFDESGERKKAVRFEQGTAVR